MFRGGLVAFLALMLVSCSYFQSEEDLTRDRVLSVLNDADWDKVDGYPLFQTCPEQESGQAMESCFRETLHVYLASAIEDLSYEVEGEMNQEVHAIFLIDKDGFINLESIETNAEVDRRIPGLKEDLRSNFSRLFLSRNAVTVSPAHKRGISVGIKVKLPIKLRT